MKRGILMYAPQLARTGARILQTAGLVLTAALAACGGGAPTTVNPNTSAVSTAQAYSGPPPATADVTAFMNNLWVNIKDTNRCGACHVVGGQGSPEFARSDDINLAYQAANSVVNLQQPSQSTMVQKVAGGHNCWLASPQACGAELTQWIQNWAGTTSTGAQSIKLVAPPEITVGATKTFPTSPALYQQYVYPIVTQWCSRCHSDTASVPQSPYFASADIGIAYPAAQPKIDLNTPTNSRFYQRLSQDHHNCWSDCSTDAQVMLTAIQDMANQIQVTPIDPTLVVSKALTLYDGTVASGQNRYTDDQIALYMFQTGTGNIAYDTSGVEPELDLTLNNYATYVTQGWGINILAGGIAMGSTAASSKLYDMITSTGEFSIEAWIVPANQSQQTANIVSYSGGPNVRNATLQQNAFQYEGLVRSSVTNLNGNPPLATNANNQLVQAALQHVVLTYDPVNGRKLYVNGQFTGDVDSSGGGTLANWDNSFALMLGAEVGLGSQWTGEIEMVAIHNRALTPSQIMQNFNSGVGEKYFLLFDVSSLVNLPQSYLMLTAGLNDSYSYVFTNPTFINLNPNATIPSINIQGIRVGVNGAEAPVGQTWIPLNSTVSASQYSANTGQVLSNVGAVIQLENGPANDQFFLSFAQIGSSSHTYPNPTFTAPAPTPGPAPADLGVRTYERINQTMAKVTGVPPTNATVAAAYASVEQSMPSIPNFDAYAASNQTAVAQLAIAYCSAMAQDPTMGPAFFGAGYDPTQTGSWLAGNSAMTTQVINAVYNNIVGTNNGVQLASQPSLASVQTELNSLIGNLAAGSAGSQSGGTGVIASAACASVLSSAAMLVQ